MMQFQGNSMATTEVRSSEDLLSHSPMVTNGTGMSPTQTTDVNNDAKKVKLDANQAGKASRVLHFRGVPSDATEGEIVQLGLPFGRMTNLVLAKKKNQALLEMQDVSSAQGMVNYYTERPPQVRGRTVFVQFSNHEQLKTETSAQNSNTQALLNAAQHLSVKHEQVHPDYPECNLQNANAQAALQAAQQLMGSMTNMGEDPKTVLRVIIEHMLYPVTIDVLKQIFQRYGQVMKIVTFSKNNTFQALIQYSDPIAAQTAKVSLNGQNIYNGCCTLRIDFSKLSSLNVKYNNDKSRDYTNPTLPSGDGAPGPPPQMDHVGLGMGPGTPASVLVSSPSGASPFAATMPGFGPTQTLTSYGAPPGMPGGMQQFYGTADTTNHYHPSQLLTTTTAGHLGALQAAVPFGLTGLQAPPHMGATGLRFPGMQQMGSVLLVSNLNEQKVTPEALFTLFGVYGDVIRVKIMFNKKDNALIQFSDATQAQLAMTHLDKIKVWGKQIKVAPSKHSVVQMPKEGQPDAGLTKDFGQSQLHRFKKPNSKNHHNIFPPSATLHLSNIPPTTTEEQLKELFEEHGTAVAFKFFQKDRKMALIQMNTVEEAVHSLMALHNHQLAETSHLRVSFSKSTITGIHPGAVAAAAAAAAAAAHQAQMSLGPPAAIIVQ